MRPRALAYLLGYFLLGLGALLLVPLALGWFAPGDDPWPCAWAWLATAGAGLLLRLAGRRPVTELSVREGILLVMLVWLSLGLFGCLPFYFSPHFTTFTDAFFEAISGFTTTGATILDRVEVLPYSLQFWRHFAHWLGGMGIVVLGLAILPLIGVGGMHLYRAEFSGAKSEKLRPRIAETALALWRIYFALTLALFLALRLAGMDLFEAVCHAFSTLGTGGFSTHSASIGGFQNPLLEYIIILFMLLAGINFTRHYTLWIEGEVKRFITDAEIRTYLLLLGFATAVAFFSLLAHGGYGVERAFRTALFQVTSIGTTTGLGTDDFERWPAVSQFLLFALMFIGGCTGSTAGGIKVARFRLLLHVVSREFKRMVERRGVFAVRLGDDVIAEKTVQSFLNLVYLALLVQVAASLLVASMGVDLLTSISAVTASMFSIGPGFGSVGPAENYSHLPALVKWVLSGCMIAGRLEFYTALVIFTPAFWRK
ncbi:MAG: TrkH family potassium uptake protein [Acidobacteria bacterium]|nr:TrkH family potassium uptake protein [Acidobacteriota bacterium]